jgi:nucleoside-diphosphate-sugar epimerase
MRVFVTGATGFIGGAIVRQLAPRHTLLAMSRSATGDDTVRKLGAEPVRCDLLTLVAGQIPACDAVVHCAAWVEPGAAARSSGAPTSPAPTACSRPRARPGQSASCT